MPEAVDDFGLFNKVLRGRLDKGDVKSKQKEPSIHHPYYDNNNYNYNSNSRGSRSTWSSSSGSELDDDSFSEESKIRPRSQWPPPPPQPPPPKEYSNHDIENRRGRKLVIIEDSDSNIENGRRRKPVLIEDSNDDIERREKHPSQGYVPVSRALSPHPATSCLADREPGPS
jgi:hypothetical protein